ncbi:hypothetical protein Phage132_247 [Escherichia phage 132]|nr:hypothetical protein Phage132_247 [Escherichia phage 132]
MMRIIIILLVAFPNAVKNCISRLKLKENLMLNRIDYLAS